jgi:F0F1-type ATP synthase membrane subunit b/b'
MENKKDTNLQDQNKKLNSINEIQKQEELVDAKMEKLNKERNELLESARAKSNSIINSAIDNSKKIKDVEIDKMNKILGSRTQKDLKDIKAIVSEIKKTKTDHATDMKISLLVIKQLTGK